MNPTFTNHEFPFFLSRNPELGQVWTPSSIADEMVELVRKYVPDEIETIVDPAVGPGIFVECLNRSGLVNQNTRLLAFDVDERMINATLELTPDDCNIEVTLADYLTTTSLKSQADLLIMNPPYIRHEKLTDQKKSVYANIIAASLGERIPKRSNLFAYFLLKGLSDLKYGGVLCAIVYDGLTETKVGQSIQEILGRHSELLFSKPVKMPFEGAIIDASILLIKRRPFCIAGYGTPGISKPLVREGYARIATLANVNRGTGLINSKYFVAKPEDPFFDVANVFIKKGAKKSGLIIEEDYSERAYLFENDFEVPDTFSDWVLNRARKSDLNTKTLFDMALSRPNDWYLHNKYRPSILFNYFIRNKPRHLFNPLNYPVADNYYGIEPLDIPNEVAWLLLNSSHYSRALVSNSRSQGNGLRKLQLYEYREATVPDWRIISDCDMTRLRGLSQRAIQTKGISLDTSIGVSRILKRYFSDSPQ